MSYDKNNIFAKILRGEIPCKKVYENKFVLSFYDVNPLKKFHVLVIPKGEYIDLNDFNSKALDKEIIEFNKAITGILIDLVILFNNSKSYPVLVPSLSIEVRRISPAPLASAFLENSIASIPVFSLPP